MLIMLALLSSFELSEASSKSQVSDERGLGEVGGLHDDGEANEGDEKVFAPVGKGGGS